MRFFHSFLFNDNRIHPCILLYVAVSQASLRYAMGVKHDKTCFKIFVDYFNHLFIIGYT